MVGAGDRRVAGLRQLPDEDRPPDRDLRAGAPRRVTDIELARIAGGTVTLHDARRKARWSVDLEPFELGVYAVTQAQLAELLGEAASHPGRPATDVSWLRAIRFCNAASEWEGLDPAYTFDGEDV